MMKSLRQLLLLTAITVGFSLTAMAQRQEDQKPPPPKKENVPKISPQPKKPDKPQEDKRDDRKNDRERPGMALAVSSDEEESA